MIDRFLPDVEFEALLASSAAVLIPYKFYFQTGVALRALEAGTPVVGRPTGFLTSIFGESFPGAVERWSDPRSWHSAVQAAVEQRDVQLVRAKIYAALGDRQWAELVTGSRGRKGGHR